MHVNLCGITMRVIQAHQLPNEEPVGLINMNFPSIQDMLL